MKPDELSKLSLLLLVFIFFLSLVTTRAYSEPLVTEETLSFPHTLALTIAHKADGLSGKESETLYNEAVEIYPYSPDLYFRIARRNLGFSPTGLINAFRFTVYGIKRYVSSFWWQITLWGAVSLSLCVAGFLLILIGGGLRLYSGIPRFIHEMEENEKRAAYLVVMVGVLFGPPYLLLAVFFLSMFHDLERVRTAIPVMGLILILTLIGGVKAADILRISSDPLVRDVVRINEGRMVNEIDTNIFKRQNTFVPRFSLGLFYQNSGEYEQAREVFESLKSEYDDPRIYINLGISLAGMKLYDDAEQAFAESLNIEKLPSAYYNLSILAREKLDFTHGDEFFNKAVQTDFERVTRYRKIWGDRNPLHFMPEHLGTGELKAFAWEVARKKRGGFMNQYGLSLLLLVVFAGILLLRKDAGSDAERCPKCGNLFCIGCQKRNFWGGVCIDCFRSLIAFESNPSERVEQILNSYNYQKKRRGILTLISFLFPGGGLILGGRVLLGIISGYLFLFALTLAFAASWYDFHLDWPGHTWLSWLSLFCAILIYIASLLYTRRRIQKGWL